MVVSMVSNLASLLGMEQIQVVLKPSCFVGYVQGC